MSNLIFVDMEARGQSPVRGTMAEFGAVHEKSRGSFHGRLFEATPDPENPAVSIVGERIADDVIVAEQFRGWLRAMCGKSRPFFMSDNPAYD